VKFIIAPHNIKDEQIQNSKNSISRKTVLFSEKKIKPSLDVLSLTPLGF
jgi:3-deoxy-D-manno-octulosonic-acid transferase